MRSRRLVVWISAGILVFQGSTLAFVLLNNCTVLLVLRAGARSEGACRTASIPPPPVVSIFDPTGHFCHQPCKRMDAAVGQGLTILAGLALGSSVGEGGRSDQNPWQKYACFGRITFFRC
jgi:hypothetical protein